MSKFALGQAVEKILEDEATKLAPLFKNGVKAIETIGRDIIERVGADLIEKGISAIPGSGNTPAKSPDAAKTDVAKPRAAGPAHHESAPAKAAVEPHQGHPTNAPTATNATPQVGLGSTGASVRELQRDLGVSVDGVDGPQTTAALKAFQSAHGLQADGIAGPKTWPVLRAEPSVREGSQGDAVRRIQGQLGVRVDGIDGPQTTAAIKSFQESHGLTPDGIVGVHTWKALDAAAQSSKANDGNTVAPHEPPTPAAPSQPAVASHDKPSGVTPKEPPAASNAEPKLAPNPRPGPSPDLHMPTSVAQAPMSSSVLGTLEAVAKFGAEAGREVYAAAVGDDAKIIGDKKAPLVERVAAGLDLASNFIDPPKGGVEVAAKLGMKAAMKGAADVAVDAALQRSTANAPVAPMHVRYAGEDRPIGDGYRQSGRILSVQDGIVTQSTGRSTVDYKLSDLTAGARDPAAIEKLLAPGRDVQISVESHALQVTSLDQHHERDRTQTHSR